MPYSKITELPKQFKNLPDGAKEIALNVINSVLEKGGDDESAFKQAWGAIKESYEKNDNNQWAKLGEMETVNIDGVEIMAVGTWDGYPETVTYTKKDLDTMVKSFDEVSKTGLHEAPVKLGHDAQQKLLQKDGYPSAGWVANLRRVGKKLVADFRDVPKKIGEIINSRGYKKVSSEIYFDKEIGGKKYDLMLKAVSLLGGDIPAVKTLDDVRALYGEDAGEDEVVVLTYSWEADEGIVSLDEILAGIDAILSKAEGTIKGKVGSPAIRTYLKEVKAKLKTLLDKEIKHDEAIDENINNSTGPEGADNDTKNKDEEAVMLEAVMLEELIVLLGLGEGATEQDALEAVKSLKAKAEKDDEAVSQAEYESLAGKVETLTATLAEKNRDALVDKAMREGKITPAQKESYDKLALDNPVLFAELMEKQPAVLDLKELGGGAKAAEEVELTEAEKKAAEKLGVSEEDLLAEKKKEKEAVS